MMVRAMKAIHDAELTVSCTARDSSEAAWQKESHLVECWVRDPATCKKFAWSSHLTESSIWSLLRLVLHEVGMQPRKTSRRILHGLLERQAFPRSAESDRGRFVQQNTVASASDSWIEAIYARLQCKLSRYHE